MRDPAGAIRFESEQVVRTLYAPLLPSHFLLSDLAQHWVREGHLIDFASPDPHTVISRRVQFVTHPAEWCDAQLFSAAQLTLNLQREGVAAGHDLKDASAWNVIFDGSRPVFCDLLSFVPLLDRRWWAMGQYARHFLLPLLVSLRRGMRAHQSFAVWRDGMPTQAARRLLGPAVFMTRYGTLLLGDIGQGPATQSQTLLAPGVPSEAITPFRNRLHTALEWMLRGVDSTRSSPGSGSAWSAYERDRPHYSSEGLDKKRATISEWLEQIRPEWVADFGCNTGEFSRMAAEQGAHVVAIDGDHDSIQQLYRTAATHWRVYPVIAQLDDIGAGRGWAGVELPGLKQRLYGQFDMVMMLALVHHLSIAASIPLPAVAAFARACTRKRAIVEILDETDPQLVALCAQRQRSPSEFSAPRQRAAFIDAGFDIEAEVNLFPAKRSLVLLRKNY